MCYVKFRAPAIKRMRGYFYFVLLIFIILLIRRAVCGNVWCLCSWVVRDQIRVVLAHYLTQHKVRLTT